MELKPLPSEERQRQDEQAQELQELISGWNPSAEQYEHFHKAMRNAYELGRNHVTTRTPDVAKLSAELETMKEAIRGLLECLPDCGNGEDWGWAWNELAGESQDKVKMMRKFAADAIAGGKV